MQDEYDAGIFSAMKEEIAALKAENARLQKIIDERSEAAMDWSQPSNLRPEGQ
jgi:uncharacterized protein YdcH (DUF465 family)